MNKKATETKEIENKTKKSYKALYWILFLAIVAGAGYFGWKNYDLIKEKFTAYQKEEKPQEIVIAPIPDWFALVEEKADKATVYGLQEKIMNLQNILSELTLRQNSASDMANLNERIDNMQDLLIASVNGKADAQSVLGLMVRLDKIENELNRLSHLNNEGAIMLAATMLIKENALEGKNFAFEAAMLSELAGYNPKIDEPLRVIGNAAQTGVATNAELAREFDEIYNNLGAKKEAPLEQSWKDRLLAKLNELITVNKTEEVEEKKKHHNFMDTLRDLADDQQFAQVAALLKDSEFSTNQAVQKWIKKVQAKQNFESAISKISSYCLVLMKVNNLLTKEQ